MHIVKIVREIIKNLNMYSLIRLSKSINFFIVENICFVVIPYVIRKIFNVYSASFISNN